MLVDIKAYICYNMYMPSNEVLYAAYGEMEAVLPTLLDRELGLGTFALLEGVELCTQTLSDVSNDAAPFAPAPLSPHGILSQSWDANFKTYVLRKSDNTASQVPVRLFGVSEEERALILNDWNLGVFGWFQDATIEAQPLSGGPKLTVVTDEIRPGQKASPLYTGKAMGSAQKLLKPRRDLLAAARAVRADYLDRISQ